MKQMSYNYVLISNDPYGIKGSILDLCPYYINAIDKANKNIKQMFNHMGVDLANARLLEQDGLLNGTSPFAVIYKEQPKGKLVTKNIDWDELTIQGKSGEQYLMEIYTKAEQKQAQADKKDRQQSEQVKSFLNSHPLPDPEVESDYAWCVIDLDKYLEMLRSDIDDMDGRDFDDWSTDYYFREDQYEAEDEIDSLQGHLGLLVGKTDSQLDKFGDLGHGQDHVYYPFYSDNKVYSFTGDGMRALAKDILTDRITGLVDWIHTVKPDDLPEQDEDMSAVADVGTAMFSTSIFSKNIKSDYTISKFLKDSMDGRVIKIRNTDLMKDYYVKQAK